MLVQAGDEVPTTFLTGRQLDREMVLGGAAMALGAHVALPLAIALVVSLVSAVAPRDDTPQDYIDDHVVEARLVRLGKKRDPDKLPDREVPRKSTAPDDSTVVSKNMDPAKPDKPDAGVRPERPEEDLLMRLGDRAQAFAEIAEEREREGDPNGVADGTATEAQAGDLYRGMLRDFFQRGWTIPSTLGDTRHLTTEATVEITVDLHVGPHLIQKDSGEALFDQSVEDRFNQLRTLGTTLPEPPPEVADQFLGKKITIRFRGKSAQ